MDYLGGLSEMNGLGSRYESDLGNMANGIQSAGATYAYQLKSVADQAKQAVDNLKAWGTDTGVELGGALAYKGLYAGSALQCFCLGKIRRWRCRRHSKRRFGGCGQQFLRI